MLEDQATELAQFLTPKAMRGSQRNWIKPELGVALGLFYMDVRGLVPLVAEEEEPVARDPQNGRHGNKLRPVTHAVKTMVPPRYALARPTAESLVLLPIDPSHEGSEHGSRRDARRNVLPSLAHGGLPLQDPRV